MPDPIRFSALLPADTPQPPHLIRNVLREGGSAILYGPTGIGKSRFLWQCACAWSAGHSAFGLVPRAALRILFVEADMEEREMRVFIAEMQAAGCGATANLDVVCYRQVPFLLAFRDRYGLIRRAAVADWLLAQVQAFNADLIIYDALADLHDVAGNSQAEAHQVLAIAQQAAGDRAYIGVLTQRKIPPHLPPAQATTLEDMLGSQAWSRRANTTLHCLGKPPDPMRAIAIEKSRLVARTRLPQIWLRMLPSGLFEQERDLDARLIDLARAHPDWSQRALAREALLHFPADIAKDESTIRRHLRRLVKLGDLAETSEDRGAEVGRTKPGAPPAGPSVTRV